MKHRAKYESIFEHSAVSLLEWDISRLRARLHEMRNAPGFDLRAYLAGHREFVQEAAELVSVTDANLASVRLLEADGKSQLLGPISLDVVSRAAIAETILAIDEGRSDIEAETTGEIAFSIVAELIRERAGKRA